MPSSSKNQLWSSEEKLCFSLLTQNPKPSPKSLVQIQSFLLRRSLLYTNLQLLTLLISSFSSSSHLRHACRLFDHRTSQDSILCNSMIQSLTHHRKFGECMYLYRDLRRQFFCPDSYSFPFLLKSCVGLEREGLQLHGHVIKMGFCEDPFCGSGLLDMYCKFGDMGRARKVFDGMPSRNHPVFWSMMIVGYAKVGDLDAAVDHFERMPERDTVAINAMIDVFVKFGDMYSARRLFDEMADRNVVSWTSLISGYAYAGDMEAAKVLFEEMPVKNLFTWNAMIGGYCKNNQPRRALELFRKLQSDSCPFCPDEVTIVSIMPAISSTGMIDLGRWIHRYARKNGADGHIHVSTALMDMYFKCGDIQEARRIFDSIKIKETASWNAMINGLAVNGQAIEAVDVFSDMNKNGSLPNEVTMIGVLSACAHGGLIEEGRKWFRKMEEDFKIEHRIDHFGCMVQLLGRGGYLEEAERLINEMPCDPNGVILSSLLSACVCCKDVSRGERVMKIAERIEPGNVRNYVMMRNLYAEAKRWGDVQRIEEVIRRSGGKREPGCSVIEVGRRVREFFSGDKAHPQSDTICKILGDVHVHIKGVGKVREWEIDMMFQVHIVTCS